MTNPLIVQDLDDWEKESLLEHFANSEEYKDGDLPRIWGYPQKSEERNSEILMDIIEYHSFEDENTQSLCEELAHSYEYRNFKESGNIEDLEGATEFDSLRESDEFMSAIKDRYIEDYLEIVEQRWDERLSAETLVANKFHRGEWASFAEQLTEWAKDHGYDGILDHAPHHGAIREIVVFEPNQIKAVDNLYPTRSDNFRDNSKEYLKEHLKDLSIEECCKITKHIQKQNKTERNKEKSQGIEEASI